MMLQLVGPASGDLSSPAALAMHGRSSKPCCLWSFLAIVYLFWGLPPCQNSRQMGGIYDAVTS